MKWRTYSLLSVFTLAALCVNAQNAYTDFHTHLTFKHFYNDISNPKRILELLPDTQKIKDQFGSYNWIPKGDNSSARVRGEESNFKNYYQTDFRQLVAMQGSILCNAFYPWEKIRTLSWTNRLIDHWFVSKLSMKRLKTISSDEDNPFDEFLAEYYFAAAQQQLGNGTRIIFAKDSAELQYCIKANITASVLTIEGAQVLSGSYNSNRVRIDSNTVDGTSKNEIMSNVNKVKNLPHRLFFITPSHFSWNRVSGYAKTLDKFGFRRTMISFLSNFKSFRRSAFLKHGEGIHGKVGCYDTLNKVLCNCETLDVVTRNKCQPLKIGREVIAELLNPNTSIHHKPTYIDVKHMDIMARMQYYELKDTLERLYHIKIPVIASHTAASGENMEIALATGLYPLFDRYEELKDPLKFYRKAHEYDCDWNFRLGHNPFDEKNIDTAAAGWFYPWSINLYNEEIAIIHDSDGIMGLMLDGRQLGEHMTRYTDEYHTMCNNAFNRVISSGEYNYNDFDEYYEVVPFIRNFIFIAEHCGKQVCWEHISIGSDFDGLIHPLKICPTAADIPQFKRKLTDYFRIYLKMFNKSEDLGKYTAEDIMDKLFYTNGRRFIIKYF